MNELVIGVDASTTAIKAIVFDRNGAIVSEGRHPIGLANPESDGWEQDAEEWWSAFERAVGRAVGGLAPERIGDVRALAVANQRETFVLVGEDGAPLHPALVWMDARCRPEVAAATRALGADHLHTLTGKPACVTPSFYKAAFLLGRKAPELRARAPRLLDVHAFLALRMTGELVTSIAAADPLGLSSITSLDWADPLLEYLGLTRASVPRLVPPGSTLGALLPAVAQRLKLPPGLPIVAGAGDGQAAGLGAGITTSDRAYMNLGTAIVSGVLSREPRLDRAFRTLAGAVPGTFFLETDLKGGLFTVGWLVDKWLGRGRRKSDDEIIRELDEEARALRPGSGGLVVVPYWNGVMNPYWDDDATGIVMGFRGDHGPAHLYRAILEGIAFEERLHSRAVEAATGTPIRELVVMGGAATSDLFCQILADVLERPIVRSGTHEATALGAAMLAALGAGVHASADDAARAMTRTGVTFVPGDASAAYGKLFEEVYAGLFPEVRARMARLRELA
ncbi:MAG: FGGY-family carbohydrate kinase [Polyangiaceae bacterium]